jgi:hypothetical protein
MLTAASNRVADYRWANGQEDAVHSVRSGSGYAVSATGYGFASDSARVTVVAELIGNQQVIAVPNDTVTCKPFELLPQSPFADRFYLETDRTLAERFVLESARSYRIGRRYLAASFGRSSNMGKTAGWMFTFQILSAPTTTASTTSSNLSPTTSRCWNCWFSTVEAGCYTKGRNGTALKQSKAFICTGCHTGT